jgi:hypothetical protein
VNAAPGKGTTVRATFRLSHIDRAPLGDIAATLGMLIMGNPHVDFVYIHRLDDRDFTLDTRELKRELEGVDLSDPVVASHLTESIRRSLKDLASGGREQRIREEADGQADD